MKYSNLNLVDVVQDCANQEVDVKRIKELNRKNGVN